MTAAPHPPTVTVPSDLVLRLADAPDAELVIVACLGVLRGFKDGDRGQLTHTVNGVRHLESCQVGMWIQAGDSLRGGQPCLERCERARLAVEWAIAWVMEHKQIVAEQPAQLELLAADR